MLKNEEKIVTIFSFLHYIAYHSEKRKILQAINSPCLSPILKKNAIINDVLISFQPHNFQ